MEVSKFTTPITLTEVNNNGEQIGILTGIIQDESLGKFPLIGRRSIVRGVPVVEGNNPEIIRNLLSQYLNLVKGRAVLSQFRNTYDMTFCKHIFEELGFSYEDHLNFLFDLSLGVDRLWNNLDKIAKKNITRAYKKGTTVELTTNLEEVLLAYDIVDGLYKKLKLPLISKEIILKLFEFATKSEGLQVFIAKNGGTIIGTRMVLLYNGYIYDYYAGALEEYYNKYPNDLLPWEVIKWGAENEMRIFDFGGAGHPDKEYGVREYKRKFGGELVNFGRFEKIHKPLTYKIAKFGFELLKRFK